MFVDMFNNKIINYNFSLIFFNIIGYTFTLICLFLLIFLFELKNFKNMNDFKIFYNYKFLGYYFLLIIMSLAGIPPLTGFFIKSFTFLFLISKNSIYVLFLFFCINIFVIYFYLQNLRFLISTNSLNFIKFNENFYYVFLLNFFIIFNVCSFFFIEYLFIKINFLLIYLI